MRKTFVLLLLLLGYVAHAQTPNRTPAKIEEDKKAAEEYKKLYPEWYRFNRMPLILQDGSAYIHGWVSGLWVQDNHFVDSVHSNFHVDMPDTTTFTPYSAISLGGPKMRIYFMKDLYMQTDSDAKGSITPTDSAGWLKDSIDFFAGKWPHAMGFAFGKHVGAAVNVTYYIRLTLNGNILYDWKKLDDLPSVFCKGVDSSRMRGKYHEMFTNLSYGYAYLICDTTLGLHDQLLIEVKESRQNWMIDRYNITRTAATPQASAIRVTGETSGVLIPPLEKKTSGLAPESVTSR